MQITLNLNEALLDEAFQLTNLATQEELLNLALRELVRSRKKNLLDLAGELQDEFALWEAASDEDDSNFE
jgi:Arc/MetJ family transcription regulator